MAVVVLFGFMELEVVDGTSILSNFVRYSITVGVSHLTLIGSGIAEEW